MNRRSYVRNIYWEKMALFEKVKRVNVHAVLIKKHKSDKFFA